MIKKVYEVDPLQSRKYDEKMKVIAVITDYTVKVS